MTFQVQFTRAAKEDLERLFDFIIERELASATGDLDIADRALEAILTGIQASARPECCSGDLSAPSNQSRGHGDTAR